MCSTQERPAVQHRQDVPSSEKNRDVEALNVGDAVPLQDAHELVTAADGFESGEDFDLKHCVMMLLTVGIKAFVLVNLRPENM